MKLFVFGFVICIVCVVDGKWPSSDKRDINVLVMMNSIQHLQMTFTIEQPSINRTIDQFRIVNQPLNVTVFASSSQSMTMPLLHTKQWTNHGSIVSWFDGHNDTVSAVGILGKLDLREIDSVFQEAGCSKIGGMCVIGSDCPKGLLVKEKGLCSAQKHRNVECCYGISVKETRCRKRGGECLEGTNPCSARLTFFGAIDCPPDTTCCILVR